MDPKTLHHAILSNRLHELPREFVTAAALIAQDSIGVPMLRLAASTGQLAAVPNAILFDAAHASRDLEIIALVKKHAYTDLPPRPPKRPSSPKSSQQGMNDLLENTFDHLPSFEAAIRNMFQLNYRFQNRRGADTAHPELVYDAILPPTGKNIPAAVAACLAEAYYVKPPAFFAEYKTLPPSRRGELDAFVRMIVTECRLDGTIEPLPGLVLSPNSTVDEPHIPSLPTAKNSSGRPSKTADLTPSNELEKSNMPPPAHPKSLNSEGPWFDRTNEQGHAEIVAQSPGAPGGLEIVAVLPPLSDHAKAAANKRLLVAAPDTTSSLRTLLVAADKALGVLNQRNLAPDVAIELCAAIAAGHSATKKAIDYNAERAASTVAPPLPASGAKARRGPTA